MPSIRPNAEGGGEKRTTFRPPWVKDGPCPLPMPPNNPWLQQAKQSNENKSAPNSQPPVLKPAKEREIKIQREPTVEANSDKGPSTRKGPHVNKEPPVSKTPSTNRDQPPQKNVQIKPSGEKSIANERGVKGEKVINIVHEKTEPTKPKDAREVRVKIVEPPSKSEEKIPQAPMPPPMMPPPPPPPPSQGQKPPRPISKEKEVKLEALRSRPRRRPDWTDMMKEVEKGIKLNHVKCNDRSAPVLPKTKTKGQFVYDSEKPNSHNLLLKEIQSGVQLKKVKTNDRSKPILEGLRKFRRQMTIEELITKSASVADVVAVASEPDELDDIDKVRDDLQSTKQMLALELRNKEALERENKRILARLANLEAELEKEKLEKKIMLEKGDVAKTRTAEDDKLINKLKEEASEATKMTKEMEEKYHKTAEELDLTRAKLESAWLKNSQLEIELKSKGNFTGSITRQPSTKKMSLTNSTSNKKIMPSNERIESDTASETETEEDEPEESNEMKAVTQEERELRLLTQKLKSLKEKRIVTNNEKRTLKSQLSRLHHVLKEEKRKYKLLQNEVEKMANIMKEVDDESNEEEEEEVEEEEDEDAEETETESEEQSDQEDSEDDLSESASAQDKIKNLNRRIKTYETLVTRAKKGNYLLKANIDRRQDDVNRQKEMSLALQEDLNAVLSELG
ncbi:unnamed protein product [Nezara viridula]|uniref:WH2 domain-containing protein n=1 Tax=Nezara viridula TaxID=85310 RepID=A0A9P0EGK4_NEZVI|nr:unnamed protein product [Nezara viridula]